MEDEETLLSKLLDPSLHTDESKELETKLLLRPDLRRQLADAAMDPETTRVPPLLVDESPSEPSAGLAAEDLRVGSTLGQGGMAIVRLGYQLKLDRAVAVKTLRPEFQSRDGVNRLLREARITGRLEHPNIAPVHDIIRGKDSLPQVVLKLIEGHTWSSLMDDPEPVQKLFGARDLLEWNLEVLLAVARALSFAHSRNVLHLDVKPSNVMVGTFGEVYLLDWGIALDMQENREDDVAHVSGTTGYMAPEQLGAHGGRLRPWTDTYLLGATLFRILTGRAPHEGQSIEERMADIASGAPAPALPSGFPQELKDLMKAVLEPDPERRIQSPEDLRSAITAFLEHRAALRLAVRGHAHRAGAAKASEQEDESAWQRAVLSAEVAYAAALEDWPECGEALVGVRQLAALRIEHELRRGDVAAAGRALAANPDVPEDLRHRMAEALAEAAEEQERLRRLVRDTDRSAGHRLRGILSAVFGLFWVGFWCFVAFRPPATATPLILFTLAFFVVGLAITAKWAPIMLRNRINRTGVMVVGAGLIMTVVWCIGGSWMGLDMRLLITGFLAVCAFFASGMATLVDPWGSVSAAGFAFAFLIAARRPELLPHTMIGAHAVLLSNQLVLNFVRGRLGFEKMPRV